MHGNSLLAAGGFAPVSKAWVDGMSHRYMGDNTLLEKRLFACESAIDELFHDDERARRQIFTKGAYGREGDDVGHPGALQYIDIGPVVEAGG